MATTTAGKRLTEVHRQAQLRIGAQTVRGMHLVWPLLDPARIGATLDRWLAAAVPIVQTARGSSAQLSAAYVSAFRALELGTTDLPAVVLADTAVLDAVVTSLIVTGPQALSGSLARGVPLALAVDAASASSAAAAMRHGLNGGRDTIIDTVAGDRRAVGWARAASGRACAFCAMLASRGPVYRQNTVGFQAHDHCSCSAEPIYHQGAPWPTGSDRYHSLWQQAKAEDGDTVSVFRHLVEAT